MRVIIMDSFPILLQHQNQLHRLVMGMFNVSKFDTTRYATEKQELFDTLYRMFCVCDLYATMVMFFSYFSIK